MECELLRVDNLETCFFTSEGVVKAVDGVSLSLKGGDTLGIVGESGCGKSVTALSILRLIPYPPGRIVKGEIYFEGNDLISLDPSEMRNIRGNKISMIFQEPMTSLNPVFRVGEQIAEAIRVHQGLNTKEALEKAIEVLRLVRIPSPESRVRDYPHQMSGGMRQRVMIAMAISCHPKLMIADEPTTALDVTIQAQILDLMKQLKEEVNTSILLITHDMGVIAENAQDVVVMYSGRIVEYGNVVELFYHPLHPYTLGLMESLPRMDRKGKRDQWRPRLNSIPGIVPSLLDLPGGCKFADRCRDSFDQCTVREPDLMAVNENHQVRCWKFA